MMVEPVVLVVIVASVLSIEIKGDVRNGVSVRVGWKVVTAVIREVL